MTRPTECERCGRNVTPIMEAEARFILAIEGPGAAQRFFDEQLEETHIEHTRRTDDQGRS